MPSPLAPLGQQTGDVITFNAATQIWERGEGGGSGCCTPFLSPDAKRTSGPGAVIVPTYGQFAFAADATDVSITFNVYNLEEGATFTSLDPDVVIDSSSVVHGTLPNPDEVTLDLDLSAFPAEGTAFITISNPCGCSAGIEILKEQLA